MLRIFSIRSRASTFFPLVILTAHSAIMSKSFIIPLNREKRGLTAYLHFLRHVKNGVYFSITALHECWIGEIPPVICTHALD